MDAAVASGRAGGWWTRRRARAGRAVAAAVVLAAAAVPVTRFLTAGSDPAPAPAPRAQTTAERLASLRLRVAANPTDVAGWRALAQAATQDAARTGDPASYDMARQAVAEATRLEPGDQRTLVIDGVLALSLHEFPRAYQLGRDAHAANPAGAEALGVLVDASVELGRYDEAATHLQAMLDLKPGSAALARASYLRELRGDPAGARAAMRQALSAAEGDPADTATVAELLGNLQLASGDIGAATASFERSQRLAPQRVGAALGLARAAAARGDLAGAVALAAATAERSPQPAAATLLGELRLAASDPAGADQAFALVRANEQLLAAAGVQVDLESALFEADHGDPARAVTLARSAYEARQTVFTADALGWALTRAGQAPEAVRYAAEAVRLGTSSAALRLHAAAAYAEAGQLDQATTQLRQAFTLAPWPALHLRPMATDLAGWLGVTLPPDWRLP